MSAISLLLRRALTAAVVLAPCCLVAGGIPIADLETTIQIDSATLTVGVPATMELHFTNHGPDDIANGAGAATGYSGTVGFRTIEVLATAETPPCTITYDALIPPPPTPSTIAVQFIRPESLGVGQSYSCRFSILAYPELAGGLHDVAFVSGAGINDPNPDNNNPAITIFVLPQGLSEPRRIPVTHPIMMLSLSILVLAVGGWFARSRL